jgi:hypothetical protein
MILLKKKRLNIDIFSDTNNLLNNAKNVFDFRRDTYKKIDGLIRPIIENSDLQKKLTQPRHHNAFRLGEFINVITHP